MKVIAKIDYEFEKILFKRIDNLYTQNLFSTRIIKHDNL